MAVGVQRERKAATTGELLHQGEVTAGARGWLEQHVGHLTGG